jgi:hypothetical protein
MESFNVYQEGQRPWPDEVTWLTRAEVEAQIADQVTEKMAQMSTKQLVQLAASVGLVVEALN